MEKPPRLRAVLVEDNPAFRELVSIYLDALGFEVTQFSEGKTALEKLEYGADEAVFVGDSPHDIKSGNAAGVITIAALWGPFTKLTLEPYQPSYFLDDIKQLPPLLDRIAAKTAG